MMATPQEHVIPMKEPSPTATTTGVKLKLHLALVSAQALFAGFEILSRVALDQGAGKTAFTFYRNCLASIILGAYSILLEREKWTYLSPRRLCYFFFLGFLGVTVNQLCYLVGLGLTSVMFASAIRNSIPIMTFILACLFKIEKVDIRRTHGVCKVVGALVGLGGSLILSLYKGPVVIGSKFSVVQTKTVQVQHGDLHTLNFFTKQIHFSMVSWHLGAIFLVLSGLAFALFLILQAPVLKTYHAPVSFASLSCFSSVLQLPLIAAAFEPHWILWRRMSIGEALSIVYAGAIGSGIVSGVQSWAVHRGGPVIVAAYQPLETLITACLSYFFIGESLHLGILLGGIIIVVGLYMLVWGQNRERREKDGNVGDAKVEEGKVGNADVDDGKVLKVAKVGSARVIDESPWLDTELGKM